MHGLKDALVRTLVVRKNSVCVRCPVSSANPPSCTQLTAYGGISAGGQRDA